MAARQGMVGYNGPYSRDSGFLEAEVSLVGISGPPDDHMIKHVDLEHCGSVCQSTTQPDIAFTWSRVWPPLTLAPGYGQFLRSTKCRFSSEIFLGTAFLAYTFGLHAVDADHIAAIHNVTRKLM